MSASATVSALRARPGILTLAGAATDTFVVRVQMPEVWDTVAVRCAAETGMMALKRAALEAFGQHGQPAEEYVLKLRGFEVLDESGTVAAAGAREGSTFLLTYRRRRPVR